MRLEQALQESNQDTQTCNVKILHGTILHGVWVYPEENRVILRVPVIHEGIYVSC